MEEYRGSLRLVVKHYPYRYRHYAYLAAQAAEAAGAQGRFWEMHDIMLETKRLDRDSLLDHAEKIGLDVARFARELDRETHRPRVERDVLLARSLDVYQTPTFVINGRTLVGERPIDQFRELIDEALAAARGKD